MGEKYLVTMIGQLQVETQAAMLTAATAQNILN